MRDATRSLPKGVRQYLTSQGNYGGSAHLRNVALVYRAISQKDLVFKSVNAHKLVLYVVTSEFQLIQSTDFTYKEKESNSD
jgi:hypothetical protein